MSDGIDQHDQIGQRRAKLAAYRKQGWAFPNHLHPKDEALALVSAYEGWDKDRLSQANIAVTLCGRIMLYRRMGKASFVELQDHTGAIQLYLQAGQMDDAQYQDSLTWDLGDIIYVSGVLFRTNKGELTVQASTLALLTKALRPLPDKFHGLNDDELRYRQRYLDIMTNEATRQRFKMRARLVDHMRRFLVDQGFMEVETPMMHVIPGGATARPFVTHHKALDLPLYLRIAPELFLKKLIVAGYQKVFELNRNFRNEWLSSRNNPEFTMVEFYQAYATYQDLIRMTEQLLKYLALQVCGSTLVTYQGHAIDFEKPFAKMTIIEAIAQKHQDLTLEALQDRHTLMTYCQQMNLDVHAEDSLAKLQLELFDRTVEKTLIQPTFIMAYPIEVSPLARRNDVAPELADRFELFIGGQEVANGFSELNDAEDQAERMRAQAEAHQAGDEEAMYFDEDYVTALEHGMPPTAGEGIGIDRLMMIFSDQSSIREVILFPLMRPKGS